MAHDMESEPRDAAELEREVDQLFERSDARYHAIMSKILDIVRSQVIIDCSHTIYNQDRGSQNE